MPESTRQIRIAIESNTGRSGKTTLATHLFYALGKKGYKVVLIDLDQNGSLSLFTGKVTTPKRERSLAGVLDSGFQGDYPLTSIWKEYVDNVRVIQGGAPLEDVIRGLHLYERKYEVLKDRLEDFPLNADVVILDTPASLEPMGLIALAASTHALIPLKPEYKDSFGAAGMVDWFYQKIDALRLRPKPEILGFVPSRVNLSKFAAHRNLLGLDSKGKTRADIDLTDTIPYQLEQMGITCFPTIKELGFILSASGTGLPVHLYQPGDSVVKSFDPIVARIINILKESKLPLTEETSYFFSGRKVRSGEEIRALNHLAFDLMRYDNAVYLANRKATNVGNNARQDNPQGFNPDRYLAKAAELLQAQEAETLAVGIAAVTGRRHTEVVVSGQFELAGHPFVLTFDGQLKKNQPVAYTIATLLPAKEVMGAIDRFRAMPQVGALAGLTSEDQLVKNFRARVNTRVKQHFQRSGVLPLLPGFESVSVHRLRGAYARMIIYHWLPNQGANEQRFLQFYLGHVEASDMKDAFNAGATTHYFGYRLEKQGKPISASGVKLMSYPSLPNPTQAQFQQQQLTNGRFAQSPEMVLQASDTNDSDPTAHEDVVMTPSFHSLQDIAADLDTLPVKLLAQDPATDQRAESTRIAKQPAQSSTTTQPTLGAPAATEVKQDKPPKRSKTRFRELRVNVDDLVAAAGCLAIQHSARSGFQALLDQVLQKVPAALNPLTASAPAPLLPDTTELLAPLMRELAAIKQQIAVGQSGEEAEQLRHQVQLHQQTIEQQQQTITQQQQVIERLQAELDAANTRLMRIAEAAQGLATAQPSSNSPAKSQLPGSETPQSQKPISQSAQRLAQISDDKPGSQSSTPTPQRQHSQPGRPPAGKLAPADRVPIAIAALMQHNLNHPADKWFLSGNVIAAAAGANPALVVSPWLQTHPHVERLLEQHHTQMRLNARSNGKEKDRGMLKLIYHSSRKIKVGKSCCKSSSNLNNRSERSITVERFH